LTDRAEWQGLTIRDLQTLVLTGQATSQEQDEERICQWVGDAAASLMEAPFASMVLTPESQGGSRTVFGSHRDRPLSKAMTKALAEIAESERPSVEMPGRVAILQKAQLPYVLTDEGINYLARIPVRTIHRELAVLMVGTADLLELNPRHEFILTTLANQASLALENARLHHEVNKRAERLAAFNRINRAITSSLDLPGVFRLLSSEVNHLIPHDRASIALAEPGGQTAIVYATAGQEGVLGAGTVVPLSDSSVGQVIKAGAGFVRADLEKEEDFLEKPGLLAMGIRSTLAVPLWDGDICFGSLNLGSFQVGRYGSDELILAHEIADQIAVAAINARLYQEARSLAMAEERNRLAREIHDSMAQGFTAIIWQLNAAERAVERDGKQDIQHLERIRSFARECLQEARRSVWDLRAGPLEGHTLAEALREETERVANTGEGQASFAVSGDERVLPAGVEAAILRICQEALGNMLKHANATKTAVILTYDDSNVRLSVRDNGLGFDPNLSHQQEKGGGGFGLINMRERAHLLGGRVNIKSEPGSGTQVETVLPLN